MKAVRNLRKVWITCVVEVNLVKVKRFGRRILWIGAGVVGIALIGVGMFFVTKKRNGATELMVEAAPAAGVPAIDAAAPEHVETATFALG